MGKDSMMRSGSEHARFLDHDFARSAVNFVFEILNEVPVHPKRKGTQDSAVRADYSVTRRRQRPVPVRPRGRVLERILRRFEKKVFEKVTNQCFGLRL